MYDKIHYKLKKKKEEVKLKKKKRSRTGRKEKLYCDAVATKGTAIAWKALELGYSFRDSQLERREQLYP